MTTKSRPETPLSKFFELAKVNGWILHPHLLNGQERILFDSAGTGQAIYDHEFKVEVEKHEDAAAAVLWSQARKIAREFRVRAAACGYTLTLLPWSPSGPNMLWPAGGPNLLLTPGNPDDADSALEETFERHKYEIAAVMRAEAA